MSLVKGWAEQARPDFLLGRLQRSSFDDQKNCMKPNWSGEFVRFEEVQKIIAEATRVIGTINAALEQAVRELALRSDNDESPVIPPECTSERPCNVPCPHCPWKAR